MLPYAPVCCHILSYSEGAMTDLTSMWPGTLADLYIWLGSYIRVQTVDEITFTTKLGSQALDPGVLLVR